MKRSAKKNSSKMHCTVWQMFLLVAKLGDFLTHTACPYLTYRFVQIDFVFAENDGQIIDHKKGFDDTSCNAMLMWFDKRKTLTENASF